MIVLNAVYVTDFLDGEFYSTDKINWVSLGDFILHDNLDIIVIYGNSCRFSFDLLH